MSVTIIAEAGVNHNGSLAIAKKLVEEAAHAGADYVKFQTFRAEQLSSAQASQADYQKETAGNFTSQQEMLRALELSADAHEALYSHCQAYGIGFLSTPFDMESIALLQPFDLPFWKIPSGEITNYPYLVRLARTGKPIVLSTGMSTLQEVAQAVTLLQEEGSGEITLLHCNTEYPTPFEDVNLRAMQTLSKRFGLTVGYSDHTPGIEVCIAAAACGAQILEKHFTLDKTMQGPDHRASLEPDELSAMIRAVRNIEKAMGSIEKAVSPSESRNILTIRKSIVAACQIKAGDVFTEKNLTTKRPASGICPMRWHEILGKRAERDFQEDEAIVL